MSPHGACPLLGMQAMKACGNEHVIYHAARVRPRPATLHAMQPMVYRDLHGAEDNGTQVLTLEPSPGSTNGDEGMAPQDFIERAHWRPSR